MPHTPIDAPPHPTAVSPALITATLSAFERTAALRAAIDLDVFTAIAEGADTVEPLARRCNAAVRGIRILADCLTVLGFLEKHARSYRLTADSAAFLDRRSPNYLGTLAKFAASGEKFRRYLDNPAEWVRRGGPDDLANTAPDNPIWIDFAEGMAPLVAPVARQIAAMLYDWGIRPSRVLDVAAGHGLYGIEIGRRNPATEIVAVDWAPVLAVAERNAADAGISDRYRGLAGNAFSLAFGTGYDLALVPNFLHHFGKAACVDFLRRIRQALGFGGRLAILEYVPNDDRVSPAFPALFALTMLAGTPSGDAYTAAELEGMCREAGFTAITMQAVPASPQSLILAEAAP
jgi:2-polyprenyl-3-methyl-5-hydroxy-6-metoxy-1,4-benzoquinol methylase